MSQTTETNSAAINELSELIAALLTTVRRLPAGPERYAALRQIGLFQVRLDTLAAQIPGREPGAAWQAPAELALDHQVEPGERLD